MTLQVLYFASLRERVGLAEETVTPPDEVATLGALAEWLARRHPALAAALPSLRLARNAHFAAAGEPLSAGDVVALLPPVSGG